jgi:hypothetical protein
MANKNVSIEVDLSQARKRQQRRNTGFTVNQRLSNDTDVRNKTPPISGFLTTS